MPHSKKHSQLPDVVAATADFEHWLGRHVRVIRKDLELKHQHMAEALFLFFRATFYRWAQWWPIVCKELSRASRVLAVGDLHVENFGTWRDLEGRLVWGVNDFDEAWPAAYTVDLVRLVTSGYLAIDAEHLTVRRRDLCAAVEEGYRDAMKCGGAPFVLAEQHRWLRLIAVNKLRDPVHFWQGIAACPPASKKPPAGVIGLLHGSLPLPDPKYELKRRVAGLGSLGHPRILAVCAWHGAHIVREGKQLRPSAWTWADRSRNGKLRNKELMSVAVRVPDPHIHFRDTWQVRRLAPDCCHIELGALPQGRDEERLLYAMGWETANIHLGSPTARLRGDLARRRGRWLHEAAKAMRDVTVADWKVWRKTHTHGHT
jgi:hypothetical protein